MAFVPSGTVNLYRQSDNALVGQCVLDGSGNGSVAYQPPQNVGSQTWYAVYQGDANFNMQQSAPFTFTINPDPSKGNVNVAVNVSPNPGLPENVITITIAVTPA